MENFEQNTQSQPFEELQELEDIVKHDEALLQKKTKKSKILVIVTGAIVLLIALVVAAYFWGMAVDKKAIPLPVDATKAPAEHTVQEISSENDIIDVGEGVEDSVSDALQQQSNSDTVSDIEADLNATDLDSLSIPDDLGI